MWNRRPWIVMNIKGFNYLKLFLTNSCRDPAADLIFSNVIKSFFSFKCYICWVFFAKTSKLYFKFICNHMDNIYSASNHSNYRFPPNGLHWHWLSWLNKKCVNMPHSINSQYNYFDKHKVVSVLFTVLKSFTSSNVTPTWGKHATKEHINSKQQCCMKYPK